MLHIMCQESIHGRVGLLNRLLFMGMGAMLEMVSKLLTENSISVLASASLHDYQNEDVSVGAWMLGLEVELVDDRKLCCGASTGLFHTPEHTLLCSSWSHLLVMYLCSCGAFVFHFHLASFAFYELMFSFVQMLLVSCSNC
jgi:hypothetical protein